MAIRVSVGLFECGRGEGVIGRPLQAGRLHVGINVGAPTGQTVMPCNVHLIPPRSGDSVNPREGVRGVIAGKADYSGGR
jgi:diadenosine tetraphosphate (Ap4A) HIT family hydrolase